MNVTKNFDTVRQNIIDQCENSILGLACGHIPNSFGIFLRERVNNIQ